MEPTAIRGVKPALTTLLKLLDKPALINWANRQGLNGIDISKEQHKWLNAGTSLHKQIELYWKYKQKFESEINQKRFEFFCSEKEIIEMEKNIETEYFVGRFDCSLKFNSKKYIVDFKSSKGIYFENKLQLVGYAMAEQCDGIAIVHIPDFAFTEIELPDRKPFEEIIKSLSIIYQNKILLNEK